MAARPLAVCIATSIHPDYDARVLRHAKSVAGMGYEVDLICPWRPHSLTLPPNLHVLPFRRVTSRRGRALLVPIRMLPLLIARRYDIYHFHDLDMLWFMALLAVLRRKPAIYDCHENYAEEVMRKTYLPAWSRGVLAFLVKWYERSFAAIVRNVIIVVPHQERTFSSPRYRRIMVRNFAERALELGRRDDWDSRPPACITTASQYVENGALLVLDVARAVARIRPDVKFYIADRYGADVALRKRVLAEIGTPDLVGHVELIPQVLPPHIMELLNRATIGLTLGLPTPTLEAGLPTKLFEYMAGALPIVAADLATSRTVVADSGCGVLVQPGNVQAFADAIVSMVNDPVSSQEMGRRGLEAFRSKYNWESEASVYPAFYDKLVVRERTGQSSGSL